VSTLQTVSGTVTDGTSPVPSTLIEVTDKWQRPVMWAIADDVGNYYIDLPKGGGYRFTPYALGYAAPKASIPLIDVQSSSSVTGVELSLVIGANTVSGQVYDSASSTGIAGVFVRAESNDYVALVSSSATGDYTLSLPAADYTLSLPMEWSPSSDYSGYVAPGPMALNVSSDHLGIDFALDAGLVRVMGSVVDDAWNPNWGVPVVALDDSGKVQGYSVTDYWGVYSMLLLDGDYTIALHTPSAQTLGYVGTQADYSTLVDPSAWVQITAYPIDSWISGAVQDEASNSVADLEITCSDAAEGKIGAVHTASDGTYRVGVTSETWSVDALTEQHGYLAVDAQSVTPGVGETLTVDFLAQVIQGPDLVIDDLTLGAGSASTGESITVTSVMRNAGGEKSEESVYVGYYISDQTTFSTANSTYLGYTYHGTGGMTSGQVVNSSRSVTIPNGLQSGTWYLYAVADRPFDYVTDEASEDNNAF
jgi:hypothetical protein